MEIPLYLLELVDKYYQNIDRADKWFYIKNPGFGYLSPYQMLKLGREDELANWIKDRLAENIAL